MGLVGRLRRPTLLPKRAVHRTGREHPRAIVWLPRLACGQGGGRCPPGASSSILLLISRAKIEAVCRRLTVRRAVTPFP